MVAMATLAMVAVAMVAGGGEMKERQMQEAL